MRKAFKLALLLECIGFVLFTLFGPNGLVGELLTHFSNWESRPISWVQYVLVNDSILFAGISLLTISIYITAQLEIKRTIQTYMRWIIIFALFLLPNIIYILRLSFAIEFSWLDKLDSFISPLGIPSVFTGFLLDQQLFQYIYHRQPYFSADSTRYLPWLVVASSIFFAVIINLTLSWAEKKNTPAHQSPRV